MKKRTLAIIVIALIVLGSLWLSRQTDNTAGSTADVLTQTVNELVALDTQQEQTTDDSDADQSALLTESDEADQTEQAAIDEDGSYTTKADVSLYLYTYGHLPENFMTKSAAQELGWSGGGLDDYSYGMCIGGDRFGNYEGLLPEASGRTYHECDIDTLHSSSRGAKRIVYSNDGLIYYTDDHYESFDLLYGEP